MEDTYVILTKPECSWCAKAKDLLTEKGFAYVEFNVIEHPILRDFLVANKLTTVPQVFIAGERIGSYVALEIEMDISNDYSPD